MKTQNTNLDFSKKSIAELTDNQIEDVKGGCQMSQSSGPTLLIKITQL